jgi:SAM-dependent methyltransferase
MQHLDGITLDTVRRVYGGAEGDLWELVMGRQIHIGGFASSMALADRAGIHGAAHGVDLCCCSGEGMRFLVRHRAVAAMTGVDATDHVIERGRARCAEEGFGDRIRFVPAEATRTGLPGGAADFVWGEDAWCYVEDKPALIAEAVRLVRPGGTIAFTDWIEGPTGLTGDEARRFLAFMKFPSLEDLDGYRRLLAGAGCEVLAAEDTGQFARHMDLYLDMVNMQLTSDALRLLGHDLNALQAVGAEMVFMQQLAHAGKIAQGRFIARRM